MSIWPANRQRVSALIVIVGFVITFAFWRLLTLSEQIHVSRLSILATHAIKADLAKDMENRLNALRRMSKVWALRNPPSGPEWNELATMFMADNPGYFAVEYADPTRHVRQVAAADNDRSDLGVFLSSDTELGRALDTALERRDVAFAPIVVSPSGIKVRRIVVPVYSGNQYRGCVIAKVDVNRSIREMLQDVADLGYSVTVLEGGQELYSPDTSDASLFAKWGRQTDLKLPGLQWTIRSWPDPGLLSELRSHFPLLAVALPLAFTGLLLLMLRFVHATSRHAREIEEINEHLSSTIQMKILVEEALRESKARFAGVLEMSADAIISTDENQRITLFNQGAESMFGYKAADIIGQDLSVLVPARFHVSHRSQVHDFGKRPNWTERMSAARDVTGRRKDGTEFPLEASISKLEVKGEKIYTAILRDVTDRVQAEEELRRAHDELEVRVQDRTVELKRANAALEAEISERKQVEEMLRQLSGTLLQAQDDERRRVARELHDSTAQYLAALALNVARIQELSRDFPQEARNLLEDSDSLVERCSSEIRTMSYLLHPPLLDDLGLPSALQWYTEGFRKRSGVEVQLDISSELGRLPADAERTLFRIVQECLNNVRKHSGATHAKIHLVRSADGARLEVSDDGHGIPSGTSDELGLLGVGIAGMRERVRQLGGKLEICSTSSGTTVRTEISTNGDAATIGANA